MRSRFRRATRSGRTLAAGLACCGVLLAVALAWAAQPARPSYRGCLGCHPEVAEAQGRDNAHAPFQSMECGSCHDPHAAPFGGLVSQQPERLCRSCHQEASGHGDFEHQPFARGRCLSCHAPHASGNGKLLRARGRELCLGCHDGQGFARPRRHAPAARGDCLACHAAHSAPSPDLTRAAGAALCSACHGADSARARQGHQGRDVGGADCTSCHSPHGAESRGLLKASRHEPFGAGRCSECHADGRPPAEQGAEVCLRCHGNKAADFQALSSHVGPGVFCVSCHSPHASDQPALQKASQERLCLNCHWDTRQRMEEDGDHRHPLVDKGECTSCHRPHGSNRAHLFPVDELVLCTSCHERHATFTHPVGPEARDPRSRRSISCITCHAPMGGPAEYNLRFGRDRELCVQCHKGY